MGGFKIKRLRNKKVVVIVQARMDSVRMPGKVLKEILKKPLLGYLIERLRRATLIDDIVIATTTKRSDDKVVKFCNDNQINCFRGPEFDVLKRYYMAAKEFKAENIVRICGDSPLIDPVMVDEMVSEFLNMKISTDYYSNTINQTYPLGMNTEIFSFSALESAYKNANNKFEREHVTPFIYMNAEVFKICQKHIQPNLSKLRLTVDQKEDFEVIKLIIENFNKPNQPFDFTLEDIVSLSKEKPTIFSKNNKVSQKTIKEQM